MAIELNNKHITALELLTNTDLTYKEVALKVGISPTTLRHWIKGEKDAGPTAQLFSEKYRSARKEIDDEIDYHTKNLRRLLLSKIEGWVKKVDVCNVSQSEKKHLSDALKAINNVKEQTFDITQIYNTNLSGEDLLNEFRRLKYSAQDSAKKPLPHGGRVSEAFDGESTEIHLASEAGDQSTEGGEVSDVHSASETEGVSHSDSEDQSDTWGEQVGEDDGGRS